MSENSTKKRVKVYKLNEAGEWDDAGTGHVSCAHLEKYDALSLIVKSEEEPSKPLLESKIQNDDIYQRQQDTLIVWQEPESGIDLALSFQEEAGCKEVWEQICAVQGKNPLDDEDEDTSIYAEDDDNIFGGISLPPANITNLEKINELLRSDESVSTEHKEIVAGAIVKENYLQKMIELFKICEETGNEKNLHMLFSIFKNMVMLNDPTLLELMFSDEYFMHVVGALEYDPELPTVKFRHRSFLQNTAVFKEVVPIRNKPIVQRIHHTFRVQYLKDVVLPRLLDDMTFATINSIIFFNNVEIAESLYTDKRFMTELFDKLKAPPNSEALYDLLCFLQELCNLAKNLQIPQQKDFYKTLAQQGIFNVFEANIAHPELQTRLSCADLVNNVLIHEPNSFRQYLLSQDPQYTLFRLLMARVLGEPDPGLMSQYVEVLRILLDTENFEETSLRDQFLTFFYRHMLKELVVPLDAPQPANRALQHEICELLAFFLQHHGFHIKYYLLGNNVVSKIVSLMEVSDKHLVLAAIRFFRALIGTKDDLLCKHIVKNKLFAPLMNVFKQNLRKYNLLNSAIIELIDFIRKENIKPLVRHVVENYMDIFKDVTYVETFKLLVSKYQQNKDYEENYLNKTFSPQGTSPQKKADSDDESYFFGAGGEDEETEFKGLVAYGMEEDKAAAEKVAELEERMKKKREEKEKEDEALTGWTHAKKQNGDNNNNNTTTTVVQQQNQMTATTTTSTTKKRKVEELENDSASKHTATTGEGGGEQQQQQAQQGGVAGGNEGGQEGGEDGEEGGEPNAPKKLKFTIQPSGKLGNTTTKPGNTL